MASTGPDAKSARWYRVGVRQDGPVRQAGKAVLGAAVALFAGAVLLALIPVRATAVEYVGESRRGAQVGCGSLPVRTQWSGDAGCDEARTRRIAQSMAVGVVSVASALVGVGLSVGGIDRAVTRAR